MTQHVRHRLVGYDPVSEFIAFGESVPDKSMPTIRKIAKVPRDDAEAIGCYELEDTDAQRIAELAGITLPPRKLYFFLEPEAA